MEPAPTRPQDNDPVTDFSMPPKERVWKNIQMVCGLFDMALAIKSLQLRRQHPEASEEWIDHEALAMIERGCA